MGRAGEIWLPFTLPAEGGAPVPQRPPPPPVLPLMQLCQAAGASINATISRTANQSSGIVCLLPLQLEFRSQIKKQPLGFKMRRA